MTSKIQSPVRVMGLDLAAKKSGVAIIESLPQQAKPGLDYQVIHTQPFSIESEFTDRLAAAIEIEDLAIKYNVDLVVIEDYARMSRGNNTTAYEHAEFGGMIRGRLYCAGVPLTEVPITSMRGFLGLNNKNTKKDIAAAVLDQFGFAATERYVKEREDVTDAFAHAMIGSILHFIWLDQFTYGIPERQSRIIYGDGKKLIGLSKRLKVYGKHEYPENGEGDAEEE